jgi:ribosome-binding factor A
MKTTGRRPARVGEMLRIEISELLVRGLRDPRLGLVTVTDVQMSPDLKHARIYVSVLGSEGDRKNSLAVLNHAAPHLRHELAARMRLRAVPELGFHYDESIEYGARIEALIQQTHEIEPKEE